uniref:MGMT family protein n=1 Tax=Ningiella ruwaisensis TaxID=2364274 RepID=UPI0010A00486|nr:MGMT family protein [Ningiella ruwaisensis]
MNAKHAYNAIFKVVNLIEQGKVASYGQVADLAGLPGRARLTGKALGHVPTGLKVNWHRVLRSNGQIAFPKGSELARLQCALLQEEGVAVFNNRVRMKDFQWQPDLYILLHELDK